MKWESTTFACDVSQCQGKFTAPVGGDDLAQTYLHLVDAGWRVHHPLGGPWRHFCPDHAGEVRR